MFRIRVSTGGNGCLEQLYAPWMLKDYLATVGDHQEFSPKFDAVEIIEIRPP